VSKTVGVSGTRIVAVLATLVIMVGLTACSPGPTTPTPTVNVQGEGTSGSTVYKGPVPTFSGPWAAGFTAAYRSTTSALDHKILATGKITDQDYAAVGSVFVSCMAAHGYRVRLSSMVDTFEIESPGTSNAELKAQSGALRACQGPFDAVSSLYLRILQNPQNQDMNVLITQCLVAKKVAPSSFTVDQYKADLQTQKFPFDIDSAQAGNCISSPLGLDVNRTQQ